MVVEQVAIGRKVLEIILIIVRQKVSYGILQFLSFDWLKGRGTWN